MNEYSLSAEITVSAFCKVEASSLEEAIEIAQDLPPAYHDHSTGTSPEENWCVTDIDGYPREIHKE